VDSVTFTDAEGEDLVTVLRWAIDEGIGYGHTLPGEPEYERAEQARKAILARVERLLNASKRREAFRARKAREV
jgi:hypothetical protein